MGSMSKVMQKIAGGDAQAPENTEQQANAAEETPQSDATLEQPVEPTQETESPVDESVETIEDTNAVEPSENTEETVDEAPTDEMDTANEDEMPDDDDLDPEDVDDSDAFDDADDLDESPPEDTEADEMIDGNEADASVDVEEDTTNALEPDGFEVELPDEDALSDDDVAAALDQDVPLEEVPPKRGFVEGDPPPTPADAIPHRPENVVSSDVAEWDPQRVDPVVVAFHDRYSAICEQYRSVRARLLTMNVAREPQVITITSAIPEEGKSVSTVNLGLVMAEGGDHQILCCDVDFRRSSMGKLLGLRGGPGLADVLRGDLTLSEALRPSPLPNLKILPAGDVRDSSYSELLGGPALATLLEDFRDMFDYTFLDTPPITTVSDVCLLAPQCSGAIIVVQMRRTPEPTVQQAVRTLQANNVKIIGSILSRFQERGSGYYAGYYSSYYYRS